MDILAANATALEAKDKELAALRERVHYAEGTAELAMKHRDEAEDRTETAERERDRIADELDTMNNNHRLMAKLLADTGRERDEAREALKLMIPLAEDTAKKLRQCGSPMANQIEKLARAARAITGEKP
jgi:hypothetical protein